MTSLRQLAVIAAGLVALAGCAKAPPPPAAEPVVDTAADEAAVRAVNPAWFAAHTAGDADAVAALYADDAVLNIPGHRRFAAARRSARRLQPTSPQ